MRWSWTVSFSALVTETFEYDGGRQVTAYDPFWRDEFPPMEAWAFDR
jgi:hypothetical protein